MGYKSIQEGKALYGVGANDRFENPMRCFRYEQGKRCLVFSLERELGPGGEGGRKWMEEAVFKLKIQTKDIILSILIRNT